VPEQYQSTASENHFFAYGGWWENARGIHHDGNFCMNGLLASDWTPHPGLNTIKYFYRNIHVEPINVVQGEFKITNWYDFVNTNEMVTGHWEVIENGHQVLTGDIENLDIAARTSKEIQIDLSTLNPQPQKEYFITFRFQLKKNTFFASKGFELAWDQFKLPVSEQSVTPMLNNKAAPQWREDGRKLYVWGDDFSIIFDKLNGRLEKYYLGDDLIIAHGPQPDFWRVPTDNDRGAVKSGNRDLPQLGIWEYAGFWKTNEMTVQKNGNQIVVVANGTLPVIDAGYTQTYRISGNGTVDVMCQYMAGDQQLPMVPRQGTEMVITPEFKNISWYGSGKYPTYQDRNVEKVGIYTSTVANEWVEYSKPQENGYRMDARWLTLTNNKGVGIKVTGEPIVGFGASHYSKADIRKSDYSFEMTKHPEIFLNIDKQQMGIGGTTSWWLDAFPRKDYRIKNADYSFTYRISPVVKE